MKSMLRSSSSFAACQTEPAHRSTRSSTSARARAPGSPSPGLPSSPARQARPSTKRRKEIAQKAAATRWEELGRPQKKGASDRDMRHWWLARDERTDRRSHSTLSMGSPTAWNTYSLEAFQRHHCGEGRTRNGELGAPR